jgi:hypothetical protein
MTKFTFDFDAFSDFHKETYGFRPRGHEFYADGTTDERRQEIWDDLMDSHTREMNRERDATIRVVARFEQDIALIQNVMDCSREQAIFHYVQSLRPDKFDLHDPGFICYENDLPYELESVIAPACAELLKMEEGIYA